ncbi:MAG TPA: hypothetical protein VFS43_41140 [Polyangiaceae bacterium]|nr:hypothetical protein [Polyangiaceae bacterium]
MARILHHFRPPGVCNEATGSREHSTLPNDFWGVLCGGALE